MVTHYIEVCNGHEEEVEQRLSFLGASMELDRRLFCAYYKRFKVHNGPDDLFFVVETWPRGLVKSLQLRIC